MGENDPMRPFVLAAAGGVIGATARWGVGEAIASEGAGFPWNTLAVNLVGCALIGLAARRLRRGSDAWYALVTGVLGGLTTFSAFAHETRTLLADGRPTTAALYVVASVIGGVGAAEVARGREAST